MDIIVTDHSKENLEQKYGNKLVYQNTEFSIMCEETAIPWLQFIPNRTIDEHYIAMLYTEAFKLGKYLKKKGFGEFCNLAKIGNKLPFYHIHLVMRNKTDEAWPEPVWCKDNLTLDKKSLKTLKNSVNDYFSD